MQYEFNIDNTVYTVTKENDWTINLEWYDWTEDRGSFTEFRHFSSDEELIVFLSGKAQ